MNYSRSAHPSGTCGTSPLLAPAPTALAQTPCQMAAAISTTGKRKKNKKRKLVSVSCQTSLHVQQKKPQIRNWQKENDECEGVRVGRGGKKGGNVGLAPRTYMVYEEDFFAWWESEVQRGGRGDLEETVGFEEKREGGHERRAVPPGDVHCVCGPADEAIAAPYERSEPIALRLGDPVVCLHADGQADMRRPAGERKRKKTMRISNSRSRT